ncbi:serine/threonine-protein kinase [Streptomyces sp. JJ38]|uniref:serine/threonine-protein kinase n=1 Tax=Streptomyces sp. JJ38 TaxID=2738128 RepID=UPI001C5819BC|nr:serine/threonine-protein kinase [Streptomyces sp. JJ38]MBW1597433.1 serine/threonine protein kinase [Streptomyces sp. JJ38]
MEPLGAEDPRAIGGYRLLRRLGAGGMGRVYLGRSGGGRTVAVKVVHAHFAADEQFRARFRREIEAARLVGGDWTAPVLDADPDAATPWVATGYVAGPDLQQAVEQHGPLPEPAVRALGAGLAEALTTVHERGLLHRDVKPSNVLLTLDGPRLIDFGIARATDVTASLTATGVSVGSPGYMSPEQVQGHDVGGPTDVFSLGAVLAFAATGRPPFSGDGAAVLLYKVVHEEPRLTGLAGELLDVVAACLAKEPGARPPVAEVARRLAGEAGAGGAAELIAGGWLPGPVVEGVSRRAVALLELEAETPEDGDDTGTHAGGSGNAGNPQGSFGPAPSAYGPTAPSHTPPPSRHTPPPSYGAPTPRPSAYGSTPAAGQARLPTVSAGYGPAGRPGPAPATGAYHPYGPHVAHGGTGPHAFRPPPRPTWRDRLPVWVGAGVAVVLLVLGFLVPLPWEGDGGDGSSAGTTGGTHAGTTGNSGEGDERSIPKGFIGTWTGGVFTENGLSSGVLTVTIEEGGVGSEALRLTTAFAGEECNSVGTVESVTDTKLMITEELVGKNPTMFGVPMCSTAGEGATLRLGEEGGTLHFSSRDQPAGNPTGKLTRQTD